LHSLKLRKHTIIVTHKQQGRSIFSANLSNQRERLFRAHAVKIARGFISQHKFRPIRQGPSYGHALLLSG
jgi:hypothetical protein